MTKSINCTACSAPMSVTHLYEDFVFDYEGEPKRGDDGVPLWAEWAEYHCYQCGRVQYRLARYIDIYNSHRKDDK